MHSPEQVSQVISETFSETPYPGDRFIQGSTEGSEPFDEVVPFEGKTSWAAIEPAFLDQRASALSFFSEGGFRFFLPAYLLADLQGKLELDKMVTRVIGLNDVEEAFHEMETGDVIRSVIHLN